MAIYGAGSQVRFILSPGKLLVGEGAATVIVAGSQVLPQYAGDTWEVGPFVAPTLVEVTAQSAIDLMETESGHEDGSLTAQQVAALADSASRPKSSRGVLGQEAFDLMVATGLPAGASFSGAGTYNSAGRLAVQSTGTIAHNPTGWYDGTACIEFTPSTDASAEFRVYDAAGFNISDEDGIAFEFGIPEPDTAKSNFSIQFHYSDSAVNAFPTNFGFVNVWACNQTLAARKQKAGQKYIRQRWDATSSSDESLCGAWPGYVNVNPTQGGTGSDRTKRQTWFRFQASNFSGKTIKFKAIRRGGRATPTIVMGSDNIVPEDLAVRAFGHMAQKALPGYVNQYLQQLTDDPASLDRMRRLYAAGFEVNGNDTVNRPLGTDVTDEATMRAAVETTRDTLHGYGFVRGSRVWIANNNVTSYLMIRELERAGYVANRNGASDGRYVFTEGGVPDAFRLPAALFDQLNFAAMQVLVDRAITYGATLWLYWHGVLSSAKVDEDRTANITGTAGAPIARNAGETITAYRARAAGLGTAIGTATVAYFDARIGNSALGVWWEELKPFLDYVATKKQEGACVVLSPEEWCADVGLMERF